MKKGNKLGIYIHLPFCHSKCAYCDFYSLPQGQKLEQQMEEYQKALLAHIATMSPTAANFQVDTIYFGGGTPTIYGASRIESLLRGIKKAFRVERDAEITVEGNPESVTKKAVTQLRRAGVNRMSLGMQSALENELKAVGRPHSPEQTREAVSILKTAQMNNLSLDLIYGLPQQTKESWAMSLEEAIALEPEHLSCYGLKVEEDTPLYHRVAQGEQLPSEDVQAELYLWTVARLKQAGYIQYEISNFAKNGRRSFHNLGYWLGKPYMGFGASASSDFGGYRYTMVGDIHHYCHCVLGGGSQIFSSNELMSQGERNQEYIMLRLRTSEGIMGEDYEKATSLDFTPLHTLFLRFAVEGWADCSPTGRWTLTPEGFLRSNLLLTTLLEAQEESGIAKAAPVEIVKVLPKNQGVAFPEDPNGQLHLW